MTKVTRIETPTLADGDFKAAYEAALKAVEPVFVPVRPHVDDRGWSLMNTMQDVLSPAGQINFSLQHPGVIKAWHRHRHQTDFWMCVRGHLKAGVHRADDGRFWSIVMGEMRPGVLIIPPTLWHGAATVGSDPSGLLYYVTTAFNPSEPDEERAPFDSFKGFLWETAHR